MFTRPCDCRVLQLADIETNRPKNDVVRLSLARKTRGILGTVFSVSVFFWDASSCPDQKIHIIYCTKKFKELFFLFMRWPALFFSEKQKGPLVASEALLRKFAQIQVLQLSGDVFFQDSRSRDSPGIQLPGSWFKWEHLLPQKWRMVQSPSLLDQAHICHGLEVAFWFVNSPFQQVLCAEICQFANWILHFLRANSQFVIKSKFLVNLPPIFPCFHGQIVKSQGIHGIFKRLIGWQSHHPGPSRRTSPCLAVPRRQRTSWGWASGWGMDGLGHLESTEFWPGNLAGVQRFWAKRIFGQESTMNFGVLVTTKPRYPNDFCCHGQLHRRISRIQSTP